MIIPVYNTPLESLKNCFDALLLDGISYEIVIVDDGSVAEVGNFCKSYAERDYHFRYCFQKNQGVSAARNTGIRLAKGDYLLFVDADDKLFMDCLKPEYFRWGYDIVFFDILVQEKLHAYPWKVFPQDIGHLPIKKDFFLAACNNRINGTYAKLIRRSLILKHNIFYDESMVVAEDAKFVFTALIHGENMFYVDNFVYQYNHSYENGDRRLKKHAQSVLNNLIHFYQYKKDALEKYADALCLDCGEKRELSGKLDTQIVEDLFNSIGTLLLADEQPQYEQDVILEFLKQIQFASGNRFPVKTLLKYWMLRHRLKPLIKICARVRSIYVNEK